ncbi:MAG: hypothetical protein M3323_00415 [Actinomycetota bacterium]|nr:hypothetical protein [Actinomycetota bacterium]
MSFGSAAITIALSLAIWIEALTLPREVWAAANYRRTSWLIYLFIPVMGLLYLLFVRPSSRRLRTGDPRLGKVVRRGFRGRGFVFALVERHIQQHPLRLSADRCR